MAKSLSAPRGEESFVEPFKPIHFQDFQSCINRTIVYLGLFLDLDSDPCMFNWSLNQDMFTATIAVGNDAITPDKEIRGKGKRS